MSVVLDILRTYRAPRQVQANRIAGAAREDRALAILMTGCGLLYVAQWPRLAREAWLEPAVDLNARLAAALVAWILYLPLLLYLVALLVALIVRFAGRPASGYACRMAIFWGLLASTPLWLLSGLAAGFSPGPLFNISGTLAFLAFVAFSGAGILAATSQTRGTA